MPPRRPSAPADPPAPKDTRLEIVLPRALKENFEATARRRGLRSTAVVRALLDLFTKRPDVLSAKSVQDWSRWSGWTRRKKR